MFIKSKLLFQKEKELLVIPLKCPDFYFERLYFFAMTRKNKGPTVSFLDEMRLK